MSNLKIALEKFQSKAEQDLKNLIVSRGHVKTGHLLKSIQIKVSETPQGVSMNIEVADYVKYLEDGKLLDDFKKILRRDLREVISEAIKKDIVEDIRKT